MWNTKSYKMANICCFYDLPAIAILFRQTNNIRKSLSSVCKNYNNWNWISSTAPSSSSSSEAVITSRPKNEKTSPVEIKLITEYQSRTKESKFIQRRKKVVDLEKNWRKSQDKVVKFSHFTLLWDGNIVNCVNQWRDLGFGRNDAKIRRRRREQTAGKWQWTQRLNLTRLQLNSLP